MFWRIKWEIADFLRRVLGNPRLFVKVVTPPLIVFALSATCLKANSGEKVRLDLSGPLPTPSPPSSPMWLFQDQKRPTPTPASVFIFESVATDGDYISCNEVWAEKEVEGGIKCVCSQSRANCLEAMGELPGWDEGEMAWLQQWTCLPCPE